MQEKCSTSAPTATRLLSLSRVLLSVTASPGVRGISITAEGKILVSHLYAKSAYAAVLTRGVECLVDGEDLKKATWLLTRLMDRVGALVKSRYYTYTGILEVANDAVIYKPYVSPTSTVEVVLSGKSARVKAGDLRKRYSTSIDVGAVLKKYLTRLEEC